MNISFNHGSALKLSVHVKKIGVGIYFITILFHGLTYIKLEILVEYLLTFQ